MKLNLDIDSRDILRIKGPAKIRVVSGQCFIAAKKLAEGSEEVISSYRTYSIYTDHKSRIEVELGSGGSIETPGEDEEVVYRWIDYANRRVDKNRRFVVMGPIESGKTTLSALLSNIALEKGLRPCIIDADVGQEDIGLPGFIAMSCPEKQIIWLRDLEPQYFRMVGVLSPQHGSTRLLSAVYELYSIAVNKLGSDVVIVNTDGWVSSPLAIELKFEIARIVRATDIAVMGPLRLYNAYSLKQSNNKAINIEYLESPKVVKARSREERKALRTMGYKKVLDGSTVRTIDLDSIIVVGSCLLSGDRIDSDECSKLSSYLGARVIYASEHYDSVYVYVENGIKPADLQNKMWRNKNIFIISKDSEKGLLCSVIDEEFNEIAPCIIDGIDFGSNTMKIITKYQGDIAGIIISRIKLTSEFEEEGRISKCPI